MTLANQNLSVARTTPDPGETSHNRRKKILTARESLLLDHNERVGRLLQETKFIDELTLHSNPLLHNKISDDLQFSKNNNTLDSKTCHKNFIVKAYEKIVGE